MLKRIALAWGVFACTLFVALPASAIAASGVAAVTAELQVSGPKVEEPASTEAPVPAPDAITAGTYAFAALAGVSLDDMSTGTTQLVAAGVDDTASPVTNIGFDFFYDGVKATQFSVNANGLARLGPVAVSTAFNNATGFATTTNAPKIAPFFDDLCVGTDGKVHYKTTGTAPNRKLIVEFQNMQVTRGTACGLVGNGTFQMWLFETTGVIEFVYGALPGSIDGGYSVGLQAGAATNFASVSTAAGTVSYAAANDTQTDAIAAGTAYTFTPNVPAAPTFLTFAPVTATTIQLNWTDNATNELGFIVNRSLDGITYSTIGQVAADVVTFADSGLAPSTVYFYQVIAFSEGAVSTALAGSQSTLAAGNVMSTAVGGLWSVPGTWAGGVVPTAGDNVTIVTGATVTIDTPIATPANALSLGIATGANLVYQDTPAAGLVVGASVTINAGGTFASAATGTTVTHALSVGADLTNNGTLDFSTNVDTAAAAITFTGAANNTFSGTGATTDVRSIVVNKGTSNVNILELTTTNFSVQGVSTDVAGFLTLTNGTFKLSGSFSGTNRVFTAAAYTIPASRGFWLNNPNYTVAGQNGSALSAGLLRISQGTFNVGTGTGNSMGLQTGSTTIVEGGSIIATGRFGVSSSTQVITYTQTGGDITVCTVGNASTTLGSFDLGTSAASTILISGGTINPQLQATTIDYRNQAGSGIVGVTAGTLRLGNALSGAARTFGLRGVMPNVVIDNMVPGHSAVMGAIATYNHISLNITINPTTTFNAGTGLFLFAGSVITNNGTLTHNAAGSRFITFTGTAPLSYTGVGVVTAPMTSLELQSGNMTIDPASPNIVATRVILFVGGFINANKLTLGTAGATANPVQIGNTTTPTAAGTFDVPMTFNLGPAGQNVSYLRTTAPRTTGGEINPARTVAAMTVDDNDPLNTLTIAGGDITVTGTTLLTNGRVITGANTLIVGTVTRTNGYVDGNLRKTFTAAAASTFEVGTANGYSPVAFNVTAGTFPAPVTVSAVQMTEPAIFPQNKAITRYWTLTATGITADLVFNYLDPTDIPGTVIEANLHLFRRTLPAGAFVDVDPGATGLNAAANTYSVNGISTFSNWTLAEAGSTPAELTNFSVE